MKENILLVEDEEALCMALSDRMRKEATPWILSRTGKGLREGNLPTV
jgi:hypothetical protein